MAERSLLLVDDEENILSALTRLLRREGYNILRATSGTAGLELLRGQEVAVIISDQRMPEMTGVEFLSKVKELYPNTVRIVLSGYTDLNSVTDAINQGAVYKFLTKPWDDALLLKNIREAFQHFELRKDNERLGRELSAANEQLNKINKDLERRVLEEAGAASRNLRVLQIAQEVLECLPVGVLGVDNDGLLVMANRAAQQLLARHGQDDRPPGRRGLRPTRQDGQSDRHRHQHDRGLRGIALRPQGRPRPREGDGVGRLRCGGELVALQSGEADHGERLRSGVLRRGSRRE